ncbi:site-specific integrase [Pseudomonas amygdali]|nr:site-specific integrase [Pseudomonas amygdali]
MARVESICYTPNHAEVTSTSIEWSGRKKSTPTLGVPMIFWADGSPWREANIWLCQQAFNQALDIKTVHSKASSLLTYARWLEDTEFSWFSFPERRDERCLDRYRGALILMRNEGTVAPSTASAKMRVVVQFYNWLLTSKLITPERDLWTTRSVGVSYFNRQGFERILQVVTTDLAIPNRQLRKALPAEGVWPVSVEDREKILDCAEVNCPLEIYYILLIGFYTGMRIQTITDLKTQTILQATPHPLNKNISIIRVGPGASPAVSTKFSITGIIEIPSELLERLKNYVFSASRIRRANKASGKNQDLVFLTKHGNPYARRGLDTSTAINVAMYNLRRIGQRQGIVALSDFSFHQTRATFATELAVFALSVNPAGAIDMVRQALLQRDESSALHYIKFAQNASISSAAANKFTRRFLDGPNE